MISYTKKALEEQEHYNLVNSETYHKHVARYCEAAKTRKEAFGYYVSNNTSTKNMLKALRMCPWQNSTEDWARLHVTEALIRRK